VAELPEQLTSGLADRYRIERELGRGGMATVYLAQDIRHKRRVALKVLHPALAQTVGPDRFQREIELAARLQHPHILTVHDSGEAAGQLWFTMPFVEGQSLRDRLRQEKQLPVEDALRIATEAARALDYAHRHGVVHRDIKPENILLTRDGDTLITDFGIARALAAGVEGPDDRLTETGMAIGTPAYMSPEQASGGQVDARTDIYTLGTVLYEMLAGEPPFTGPTAQAITAKRFRGEVPHVRQARSTVPESVDHAIQKALALVPADRFSSAAEFARALALPASAQVPVESVATSAGTVPLPPLSMVRRRPRIPLTTTALVVGFLLGLGVLFGWLRSHGTRAADRGAVPKRVAVLPFESAGDTSDRAFAAGVSEEITTRLARVPGLRLIARSSALQYPQSGQTAPQFGRALGVDYVLDGTVRSAAGPSGQKQLRITPELIKVADGTHVWGEPYEGVMADVFRLQADVAERVAEALRGTLGGGEQRVIRAGPTQNLEAFRLYILGRAEWNRRTPGSLAQAADYFKQAIALDSTFARAWAGLADAYALYDYYGVRTLPRDTAYARAKEAALRALAIDSTLAEPHASLNQILRYGYWDWAGSEREVRKAIALDPDYATAHKWLAEHLLTLGRFPEAIAEAKTAVQLDPLSPSTQNALGIAFWYAGQIEEAIAVFRSALARDSTAGQAAVNLFSLYVVSGRTNDALAFLAARHDTSTFRRSLVRARTDPAARAALLIKLRALRGRLDPTGVARVFAVLGDRETALAELERAVAERDPELEMIKVEPYWASVRRDPRFAAVVRRAGLPP
jgi:TolB-like protein/tRNA A-37 threonylcarbamoyl transferase component Bud32